MLNEFLLNWYRVSGFALMVLLMEVSLCDGVLPYIASWNVNYDMHVLDISISELLKSKLI